MAPCFAQDEPDSVTVLGEVIIKTFEQNRTRREAVSPVSVIRLSDADLSNKISAVQAFNTIAGVRMEERSPGSYRLNIRGSSLRSPFGVRNVKVYWNAIPVTDAGGNTYLNQFSQNAMRSIEIFKGPAGSLYGAGTGGLVLIDNFSDWNRGIELEYITGSYNLHNVFATAGFGTNEKKSLVSFAHNQTEGYRVQTKMRRDNFFWQTRYTLSPKQNLTAALLFTDMYYQTPGALTPVEFNTNPRAARPAAGGFPSAVSARAAIYQKNLLAGFTHSLDISSGIQNSTTLYGSFAQVKNPAIRNYERRIEPGYGGRTLFTLRASKPMTHDYTFNLGAEFQQGFFNTQVSKNKNGQPDTLQTNDDIDFTNYSFFGQADAVFDKKWILSAGISLNKTKLLFRRLNSYPILSQERTYRNELAPRLAIRRNFTPKFSASASVSRGFSPPTIAELLPSNSVISTHLEAEYGWNYELTLSYLGKQVEATLTGFYFTLDNALVQRRDLSGADFFVNAGDSRQNGIETHVRYKPGLATTGWINRALFGIDYSYHHFRYGSYSKGTDDFSGNTLPSVPAHTVSAFIDLQCKYGLYTQTNLYTASKIFLNDANSASTGAYHLLGWRFGWKSGHNKQSKHRVSIYAGVDNLLDEQYSLGNDINAPANRFYNAAPRRNYYAGLSFNWIKAQ